MSECTSSTLSPLSPLIVNFKKDQTGEERKLLSDVSGHVSHPGMCVFLKQFPSKMKLLLIKGRLKVACSHPLDCDTLSEEAAFPNIDIQHTGCIHTHPHIYLLK